MEFTMTLLKQLMLMPWFLVTDLSSKSSTDLISLWLIKTKRVNLIPPNFVKGILNPTLTLGFSVAAFSGVTG